MYSVPKSYYYHSVEIFYFSTGLPGTFEPGSIEGVSSKLVCSAATEQKGPAADFIRDKDQGPSSVIRIDPSLPIPFAQKPST